MMLQSWEFQNNKIKHITLFKNNYQNKSCSLMEKWNTITKIMMFEQFHQLIDENIDNIIVNLIVDSIWLAHYHGGKLDQ